MNRFDPERVSIRIFDAPAPVAAASEFDVETVISSTESISGRMYMNNPSVPRLSWTLMPSSVMLIAVVDRPLIVDPRVLLPVVLDARQADDVVERGARDDRQLLNLLDRDRARHRRARRLHDLGLPGDDHRLLERAHLQRGLDRRRGAGDDLDVGHDRTS